jgi:hypothetical protein
MSYWSLDFTLSKRHLGLLILLAGLLLAGAALAAEIREPGGFGTVQKMAAFLGVGAVVIGSTLLPFGSRPA